MWVSLAIGLPNIILDWSYLTSKASTDFTLFVLVGTFAFNGFLIWKTAHRRNWARRTLFVLWILGIVPWIGAVRSEFARSALLGTISLLQVGMQIIAFFLIFTSPGKEWFRPTL